MIQFNLHCPHCFEALSLTEYAQFLRRSKDARIAACVMCGRPFINYDVDLPRYQESLTKRIEELEKPLE